MSYVMTIRLPDGATLKRPAREAAGLLEVTVADDDVAGIPDLRADVAELGGEVVTENGSTSPRPGTEGDAVQIGQGCLVFVEQGLHQRQRDLGMRHAARAFLFDDTAIEKERCGEKIG